MGKKEGMSVMKKLSVLILALSLLLCSACSLGKSGIELETDYHISTEVNEEEYTVRYTLDGYDGVLEFYYERPYFVQRGAGFDEINRYFEELTKEFFKSENVSSAVEYADESKEAGYEAGYTYKNGCDVTCKSDKLISVTLSYEWYMGGVLDYGTSSYVFDTATGEILKLSDITGLGDDELKRIILNTAADYLPDGDISYIEDYTANQFEFCVEDDVIYINFDKYEASYGAAGAFHIPTSLEIRY